MLIIANPNSLQFFDPITYELKYESEKFNESYFFSVNLELTRIFTEDKNGESKIIDFQTGKILAISDLFKRAHYQLTIRHMLPIYWISEKEFFTNEDLYFSQDGHRKIIRYNIDSFEMIFLSKYKDVYNMCVIRNLNKLLIKTSLDEKLIIYDIDTDTDVSVDFIGPSISRYIIIETKVLCKDINQLKILDLLSNDVTEHIFDKFIDMLYYNKYNNKLIIRFCHTLKIYDLDTFTFEKEIILEYTNYTIFQGKDEIIVYNCLYINIYSIHNGNLLYKKEFNYSSKRKNTYNELTNEIIFYDSNIMNVISLYDYTEKIFDHHNHNTTQMGMFIQQEEELILK